ncbi:hypothetical protein Scep_012959 [Stephania cephalantha]|uniref:Uncharacterized protein n=1 Tax=Stephania cephalantha TaxID=152367 RepID=A0AAP0JG40_9MAGN
MGNSDGTVVDPLTQVATRVVTAAALDPLTQESTPPGRGAEKLGRPPTALELCLYFYTKDHYGVTFLDSRVDKIFTVIHHRRIELTQSQPDTPIDETELYLSIVEHDNKGWTYGLGWTPSGLRRRHATAGAGAGGGDGAGSSRPISSPNEPIELLRRDFKEMQTHILRVMQDQTLTRDELREVQGAIASHVNASNRQTWDFIRASERCSN